MGCALAKAGKHQGKGIKKKKKSSKELRLDVEPKYLPIAFRCGGPQSFDLPDPVGNPMPKYVTCPTLLVTTISAPCPYI